MARICFYVKLKTVKDRLISNTILVCIVELVLFFCKGWSSRARTWPFRRPNVKPGSVSQAGSVSQSVLRPSGQ